jgi:hypothetical protein
MRAALPALALATPAAAARCRGVVRPTRAVLDAR